MLWLVLKSYEVIFKRFLVFSQSDEQSFVAGVGLEFIPPGTTVWVLIKLKNKN